MTEIVNTDVLDSEHAVGEGLDDDALEWLRTETWSDFRIDIWDTHRLGPRQRPLLAYRLSHAQADGRWEIVRAGEDYEPGMLTSIDSVQSLADVLGFLSCKPGDVEDDYFKTYTPRQLEWVAEHGEELSIWSAELEGALE